MLVYQHLSWWRRHLISILTAIIPATGFLSCDSDLEDPAIDFVGDSIVSRWDINADFPSYYVYNYGVGGSGIDLIISYNSKFRGNDVVVLSGTNDNSQLTDPRRDQYAQKYLSSILDLTDKHIYLFSLLPRNFDGDRAGVNNDIKTFNNLIHELVKDIDRVTYIDVFDEFMKDDDIDYKYFSDGLHPNLFGYEILSQKLLKAL